jgi:hypothetical protein
MLDDLRSSASDSPQGEDIYYEDDLQQNKQFLGMTAPQRFIVVLMLLIMVCILGTFVLVIFGKVMLPFL